jgi:hypothetical protein
MCIRAPGADTDVPAFLMESIPADILDLLRHRVSSLEELEILLLLRRTSGRAWEVFEIARELGLTDSIVENTLAALRSAGFFAVAGSGPNLVWRYAPASAESSALLDRLAQVYDDRRLEVMRLLSTQALERVRTSAVRAFADAFVIGRKRDG